jgi:hypothetical protein
MGWKGIYCETLQNGFSEGIRRLGKRIIPILLFLFEKGVVEITDMRMSRWYVFGIGATDVVSGFCILSRRLDGVCESKQLILILIYWSVR